MRWWAIRHHFETWLESWGGILFLVCWIGFWILNYWDEIALLWRLVE